MHCPYCLSTTTTQQSKTTALGYRTSRCSACRRLFNERTGTPFNSLEYPTDIVLLVVLWRLRYKLSLRDLAEMFLERGFVFTHEAVQDWEARFVPLIADQLRIKRRGQEGKSWHVDEIYISVHGKWCGCVAKIFKLIKMKYILQSLQVKQVEDVHLLRLKFNYVVNALIIMMSLKIFATQPFAQASSANPGSPATSIILLLK